MTGRLTAEGFIDTNPPADLDNTYVTITQLCERFHRDERTIRRWLRRDNIPRTFTYDEKTSRDLALVRWGDILNAAKHSTRWRGAHLS